MHEGGGLACARVLPWSTRPIKLSPEDWKTRDGQREFSLWHRGLHRGADPWATRLREATAGIVMGYIQIGLAVGRAGVMPAKW